MPNFETRHYGKGTFLVQSFPWGGFHSGRALCPDGQVRALKRISETSDTFFSIPAAVAVRGRTVSGYVTFATDSGSTFETPTDPKYLEFRPYRYGKNCDAFTAAS